MSMVSYGIDYITEGSDVGALAVAILALQGMEEFDEMTNQLRDQLQTKILETFENKKGIYRRKKHTYYPNGLFETSWGARLVLAPYETQLALKAPAERKDYWALDKRSKLWAFIIKEHVGHRISSVPKLSLAKHFKLQQWVAERQETLKKGKVKAKLIPRTEISTQEAIGWLSNVSQYVRVAMPYITIPKRDSKGHFISDEPKVNEPASKIEDPRSSYYRRSIHDNSHEIKYLKPGAVLAMGDIPWWWGRTSLAHIITWPNEAQSKFLEKLRIQISNTSTYKKVEALREIQLRTFDEIENRLIIPPYDQHGEAWLHVIQDLVGEVEDPIFRKVMKRMGIIESVDMKPAEAKSGSK